MVDRRTFEEWVESTIEEWLPGYTLPNEDEDDQTQYKIKLLDSPNPALMLFEVENQTDYTTETFVTTVLVRKKVDWNKYKLSDGNAEITHDRW